MPQITLPGETAPTDCSFEDLARWDGVVRDGKAKTREQAAAAEMAAGQAPAPADQETPAWTLRQSPEDYLEAHAEDESPSDHVRAQMDLARAVIALRGDGDAPDPDQPEPSDDGDQE